MHTNEGLRGDYLRNCHSRAADYSVDSGKYLPSPRLSHTHLTSNTSQAPLARSVLPPPGSNAANSGTTLALFLRNVMGFDLSAYQDFLQNQGCDIAILSRMSGWERERMREVLWRVLLAHKGVPIHDGKGSMKALEVLALELALRRAGQRV